MDDFNFPIVNYPFLDSNIAKGSTYGVIYLLANFFLLVHVPMPKTLWLGIIVL